MLTGRPSPRLSAVRSKVSTVSIEVPEYSAGWLTAVQSTWPLSVVPPVVTSYRGSQAVTSASSIAACWAAGSSVWCGRSNRGVLRTTTRAVCPTARASSSEPSTAYSLITVGAEPDRSTNSSLGPAISATGSGMGAGTATLSTGASGSTSLGSACPTWGASSAGSGTGSGSGTGAPPHQEPFISTSARSPCSSRSDGCHQPADACSGCGSVSASWPVSTRRCASTTRRTPL